MATNSVEELNMTIASNLRELRRTREMSLDEAAETTGVSKSMLGQIERGECGLSVATLWKICTGLKISFTALMTEEQPGAEVVDNKAAAPLTNDQSGFRLYSVFPIEASRGFEILYIEIDPGIKSGSEPHEHGTEEFVLVYDGNLTLELSGEEYSVPKEHSIRYMADQSHAYVNKGDSTARLFMVIRYTSNL